MKLLIDSQSSLPTKYGTFMSQCDSAYANICLLTNDDFVHLTPSLCSDRFLCDRLVMNDGRTDLTQTVFLLVSFLVFSHREHCLLSNTILFIFNGRVHLALSSLPRLSKKSVPCKHFREYKEPAAFALLFIYACRHLSFLHFFLNYCHHLF